MKKTGIKMSYKEAYNEWASDFEDENGRDPTLEESKAFENDWMDGKCDLADCYRHGG